MLSVRSQEDSFFRNLEIILISFEYVYFCCRKTIWLALFDMFLSGNLEKCQQKFAPRKSRLSCKQGKILKYF